MLTPQADRDTALFKALVDDATEAFAVLDATGRIRYVSPSAARIHGYAPEERVSDSFLTIVHEDDGPVASAAFGQVLAAPGASETFLCRVRHTDGSWRYVDITYINRLTDLVGGVIVNYRDVSRQVLAEERLRRSEARYRSLIQGAAYGIYRSTIDGEILDANPAFLRMLGYESVEEARTLSMRDLYESPDDREGLIRDALAAGNGQVSSVVTWKRRDGAPIAVQLTAQVVDFEGSGATCFEGVVEDITTRQAHEEQVRQAQKMEAVGRLARGIAHDFNNVLAAILGNADLLHLRLKKNDPMLPDLLEISSAAERGAALTRQLLAFSQPRKDAAAQVLDLHAVVQSFDSMLQRLSGDVELRLHTPGGAPSVLLAPGRIEQIVMNLVLNAREAVSEGGAIDVYADTTQVDAANVAQYPGLAPGRYARIAVHDDGPGISPGISAHLFEPFFSTKDPAKGPGLGLSIVYGIAKDAGGLATFSSSAGGGTTFEVLLPLA